MSRRPFRPVSLRAGEAGKPRRGLMLTAGGACALALAALLGLMPGGLGLPDPAPGRVRAIEAPEPLDSRSAERLGRRVSAAHADVAAIWRHEFRWRLGRSYAAPEVIHFTGRRPSPCGDARGISGLAYCALDRTVSLDLAFLGELAASLGEEGERAIVLLVARVAAEHVQAELAILGDADRARRALSPKAAAGLDSELALQGDCLTGLSARRASARVGEVAPGSWSRIVAALRDASGEAAGAARLASGEAVAREAAFARGYADGQLRACLAPGLTGVLG